MSRSILLALLALMALTACTRHSVNSGPNGSAPPRVVIFRADSNGQVSPEHVSGVAYVRPDRIDIAVTEADLHSDAADMQLRQVRALLVKSTPGGWDVAKNGSAVPVARLRALARSPADTVWFAIRNTAGEPLADRRLSFLVEAEITIPGNGTTVGTRPIHGPLGILAAP